MPRSPVVYSLPPGTTPQVPGTVILSSMFNAALDDLAATLNTAQPVQYGGTGGTSVITGWDGLAAGGTDIATATSINLTTATGPILALTGTTTVTGVTLATNAIRFVRAVAAFQLTASANLIVNKSTSVNYTTSADDLLIFIGGAAGVVRVYAIGSASAASNAEVIAGTVTNKYVSPATAYFPTGYLSGFLMTPAADAANDFSMAIGSARSTDDTTNIVLGSALIKQIDATWVVGTNQGGRFFTTLTAGSQIYAYVIKDPVNNLVDWGYSDNATNPTGGASYPAAYTKYARVSRFWRTAGSSNNAARQESVYGTDWVSYTPTFTSFGTVTGISMWSRRVGDTLEVRGKFTSGTAVATEARVALGFNGGDGNVTSDATKVASIQTAGTFEFSAASFVSNGTLIEGGVAYFTFGQQDSGTAGLSKVAGSTVAASGRVLSVLVQVPIAGW